MSCVAAAAATASATAPPTAAATAPATAPATDVATARASPSWETAGAEECGGARDGSDTRTRAVGTRPKAATRNAPPPVGGLATATATSGCGNGVTMASPEGHTSGYMSGAAARGGRCHGRFPTNRTIATPNNPKHHAPAAAPVGPKSGTLYT